MIDELGTRARGERATLDAVIEDRLQAGIGEANGIAVPIAQYGALAHLRLDPRLDLVAVPAARRFEDGATDGVHGHRP